MPSYYEILHVKLSKLTSAADGWKEMATRLKKLEDLYEKNVQSVTKEDRWLGESASIAAPNFAVTRGQYDAAQKEALAMESLLRDAHGQFTDLRAKVESAVADAVKAGMKVSDSGVASYDYSKVDTATAKSVRHDPELRNVEMSYTSNIGAAVKAVNEFDQDVKTALLNASGADGTAPFGFNAKPVGDVEAVEAIALSEKVKSGEASDKELRHYSDVMRENAKDKHFSEAYLHALGAEDAARIADRMHLASSDSGVSASDKKLYNSISESLANTVASGTKDPNGYAYKPFLDGLKGVGPDRIDRGASVTSGYQAFVTLMKHGEGYGKEFLNDVGHDIIKNEDPDRRAHAFDATRPGLAVDPLDDLLGIMSEDPEAAEYFLDPEAEGNKNEHLQYLLTDRKWPYDDIIAPGGAIMDVPDPEKAAGLGAAIEAASTGHEPGGKPGEPGPHTDGQARVMHNAIRFLDKDASGDEFPKDLENIRQPMARALTDYVADTHIILNGQESAYGGIGGKDSINGSGDNSHLAVGQASLVRVMRGIAEDAPAFSLLYETERAYVADELARTEPYNGDKTHGVSADWDHCGSQIGGAMGVLNGIGADVYDDKEKDKAEWAEDTAAYSAAGANGLIGEIPVLGTVGGSIIDAVAYDWTKDVVDAAEAQGKEDASDNFAVGMDGTNKIIDKWGEDNGISGSGAFDSAKDSARDGHDAGRNAALTHL
ncbi:hypothetical protein [Streptomyces clavifer]|uniref:hypothetical protein n=1 Tax=Streptomyces clavifer TaxID=68188 RepID=UPI00344A328F